MSRKFSAFQEKSMAPWILEACYGDESGYEGLGHSHGAQKPQGQMK